MFTGADFDTLPALRGLSPKNLIYLIFKLKYFNKYLDFQKRGFYYEKFRYY